MVFQTLPMLARSRGPDEFWRKRRIFRLSAHFVGRSRNCYSLAIRAVHRALQYCTKGRKLKKKDMTLLWETRLHAACEEHNFTYPLMKESLSRCDILLNKKVLSDLAIWEPRTFKSLTKLAWSKAKEDGLNGVRELGDFPPGIITRGMLK